MKCSCYQRIFWCKKKITTQHEKMMENHDNFNGIKINCHLIGLKMNVFFFCFLFAFIHVIILVNFLECGMMVCVIFIFNVILINILKIK